MATDLVATPDIVKLGSKPGDLDILLSNEAGNLNAMREALRDELAEAAPFPEVVGDIRMLRFLRGFKYDLAAATEAMRAMLRWRKERGIDAIRQEIVDKNLTIDQFPHYSEIMKYWPVAFDHKPDRVRSLGYPYVLPCRPAAAQDGRPVWISKMGLIQVRPLVNMLGIDNIMHFYYYVMEYKSLQLEELSRRQRAMVRLLAIRDLRGVGMHLLTKRAREFFQTVMLETQGNYPEMMEKNFFVNVPWVFHALFRIVRPMIAERTLHKLAFAPKDPSGVLREWIDPAHLPRGYGGEDDSELFPHFLGTSDQSQSVSVSRGSAQHVQVPLGEGDMLHWELSSTNHDIAHAAWFVPKELVGVPRSSQGTDSAPPTPVGGAKAGRRSPATAAGRSRVASVSADWQGTVVCAAPVRPATDPSCVAILDAGRVPSVAHSFRAPEAGTVVLALDNSFSWVKGKEVTVTLDVVPAEIAAEVPEVAEEKAEDIAVLAALAGSSPLPGGPGAAAGAGSAAATDMGPSEGQ